MSESIARLPEDTRQVLLFFFVVVPLVLLFMQFGYRYVLTYRLTDKSILLTLFGVVPVFRIKYDDVEEIKTISFWEGTFKYFWVFKLGNRLFGREPGVLI